MSRGACSEWLSRAPRPLHAAPTCTETRDSAILLPRNIAQCTGPDLSLVVLRGSSPHPPVPPSHGLPKSPSFQVVAIPLQLSWTLQVISSHRPFLVCLPHHLATQKNQVGIWAGPDNRDLLFTKQRQNRHDFESRTTARNPHPRSSIFHPTAVTATVVAWCLGVSRPCSTIPDRRPIYNTPIPTPLPSPVPFWSPLPPRSLLHQLYIAKQPSKTAHIFHSLFSLVPPSQGSLSSIPHCRIRLPA
ncbi:hypothetical protein QBC43DRAFT_133225 [Cladorrhinum sp. PSN259]|nr:hypothetical protein QBC43DRAFT_133225 [Cladorrhinum sp. PSN259]